MKTNKSNPANAIAKYLKVYLVSVKEVLFYPQKMQATVLLIPIRVLVFLFIYDYAFKYIGRPINGINAQIAVWGIAIYQVLLFAQFRGIFRTISEEIKNGSLETQLNKPYEYLFYKFWEHLGKGSPNFLVSLAVVLPFLLLFVGGVPDTFRLTNLIGFLFLVLGGTLVSAALYILIIMPAFWIEDAQPLFWITDKLILVLGGAFVPLALLPQSFQTFANLTPFGAPMFATQMFYPTFAERWGLLFLLQLFWIAILSLAILVVFSKAKLKMSINGG